jgi:hypothetical protein
LSFLDDAMADAGNPVRRARPSRWHRALVKRRAAALDRASRGAMSDRFALLQLDDLRHARLQGSPR